MILLMEKKSGKSIDKFEYHYEQGRIYMSMENRPLFYRVLSISGGAGFLLSTVAEFFSPNGFFEMSKPLSFLLFFKCHQNKGVLFSSLSSGLGRIWYKLC